jgi:hypothetical protein
MMWIAGAVRRVFHPFRSLPLNAAVKRKAFFSFHF